MTTATKLTDLERALNYLRPSSDPNWQYFRNNLYVERADEAIETLEDMLPVLRNKCDTESLQRAENLLGIYIELEKIFKKAL